MRRHPLLIITLIPLASWFAFILPDLLAANTGLWAWRRAFILVSGILALWWMSAAMLLAARPVWLESLFGGLDKLYRLHRNLGIGAGILILLHWQLEWLPKTLAKAGWITRPGRGPRGGGPEDWLIGLAKEVGEWAGYLLLTLVAIALLKRIPYRYFRWVHKAFPVLFIGGAFHGLLLMPRDFWQTPLAWATLLVAAVGVVPAILSLTGRVGQKRQFSARIESIENAPDKVLIVTLRPESMWPGHRAGQFLFADFGHRGEGAHPFTIASAWNQENGTLTLAIKALGDYTTHLPQRLAPGQRAKLEGPYGRFDFEDAAPHQIWIGGGIGVTPFLARLQALAQSPDGRRVDFFYSLPRRHHGDVSDQLSALCASTGVRLHLRETDVENGLTQAEIDAAISKESSVWFCGPRRWGETLQSNLAMNGGVGARFHRECFDFR